MIVIISNRAYLAVIGGWQLAVFKFGQGCSRRTCFNALHLPCSDSTKIRGISDLARHVPDESERFSGERKRFGLLLV